MNPNTEYERFTLEVFRQLSSYHHYRIKNVQHNVKLEGRSGCKHQIDVYWEYENNGVVHRVAIECKNYNNAVSKGKVCAFQGVLSDLDNIEGIMITKKSYQSGARKYAKQYGILLKELREPGYGETIVGEIVNNLHIEMQYPLYKVDEKWAFEHNLDIPAYKRRMTMAGIGHYNDETYTSLPTSDSYINDDRGNVITSIEILRSSIPNYSTNKRPYVFPFEDAYVNTPWGPLKILEIKFEYKVEDRQNIIQIDAEGFVKAILKDTFNGKNDFVVMRY